MTTQREYLEGMPEQISFGEWMVSAGVFMDLLSQDLTNEDTVYGEDWQETMSHQLHLINRVGRAFYDQFSRRFDAMRMQLPDDVGVLLAPNPNYQPPTEEPLDKSNGSTSETGDVFPF